jgi:hypothetical protein
MPAPLAKGRDDAPIADHGTDTEAQCAQDADPPWRIFDGIAEFFGKMLGLALPPSRMPRDSSAYLSCE